MAKPILRLLPEKNNDKQHYTKILVYPIKTEHIRVYIIGGCATFDLDFSEIELDLFVDALKKAKQSK
jgi:hypothetical protein